MILDIDHQMLVSNKRHYMLPLEAYRAIYEGISKNINLESDQTSKCRNYQIIGNGDKGHINCHKDAVSQIKELY